MGGTAVISGGGTLTNRQGLLLACGQHLPEYQLRYETYGTLNEARNNALLICHALTGTHHVAGYYENDEKPGWWDNFVGPGKPIDTDIFYVVGVNNIGGCNGSTGPTSINPQTKQPYGPDFPPLRIRDWVQSQHWLMQQLNIPYWAAVVGGSMGGMQAMRWCVDYPDTIKNCVTIASAPNLTAQNIAFNELARQAITKDPAFADGQFMIQGNLPENGLALARMIGHVTYLSGDTMNKKFGRELQKGSFEVGQASDILFQVESYLRYQGQGFSQRFDANAYILLTKVLDYFDLSRDFNGALEQAFQSCDARHLVVSFNTDWRFSPSRSQEIVKALIKAKKNVSYTNIESAYGHDAFLLPNPRYETAVREFLRGTLI